MPSANSQSATSQTPWPPAGVEWYYSDDHVAIAHGDCRELLPHIEADVLVTDPPYGVSKAGSKFESPRLKTGGRGGTRKFDFFDVDRSLEEVALMVSEAFTLSLELVGVSTAYIFCGWQQHGLIRSILEDRQWRTRQIVWAKRVPPPALPGTGWPRGHETAIAGFGPGWTWAHEVGEGPRSDVVVADNYRHGQPGKVNHPTQKPLSLLRVIVGTTMGVILDPFMGSGTTLRAAKDLGRKAIGIELEERYCEIAAERCSQEVLDLGAAA